MHRLKPCGPSTRKRTPLDKYIRVPEKRKNDPGKPGRVKTLTSNPTSEKSIDQVCRRVKPSTPKEEEPRPGRFP